MCRWTERGTLRYTTPTPKLILLGVGAFGLATLVYISEMFANEFLSFISMDGDKDFSIVFFLLVATSIAFVTLAVVERITRSDARHIKYLVKIRLCRYNMGNPLHLREGEIEPHISVNETDKGYKIRIRCRSAKFDDVSNLETVVSDCLDAKLKGFGVVAKDEDIAGRYVDFYVEDVVSNSQKQFVYKSVDDIKTDEIYKLPIREDVCVDYSKVLNTSAIVAGRSRSGKTSVLISTFLLPVLKNGRDEYGSSVTIIDPKSAELSQCPHVLSPKLDGNVEHILEAIREFNNTRIKRQRIINEAGRDAGVTVKWFELMKPSLLVLDEFISLQNLFPKKPSKEKPSYCLDVFRSLLLQISTQGASAGVFLVLSTAEASVGTGGLEAAVNNACGIRILLKPTKDEARYLWSSEKLEVMRERQFIAGDAWFSADDGINNSIRFVKFPFMKFGEYPALSALLTAYYD